ncbi:YjcZ family sporulation protein [Lysinibacillus xylanilyticus]
MEYSGSNHSSSRFALIVVLFILLIIVGASFMHY